jgi:hypothetical protein
VFLAVAALERADFDSGPALNQSEPGTEYQLIIHVSISLWYGLIATNLPYPGRITCESEAARRRA